MSWKSGETQFASTFGYLFEHWCAGIAQKSAVRGAFKGKLVLPTATGADDEIEDVVVIDRDRVVLFSAKSSLVPETSLKCATSQAAVIKWLRRFYFDAAPKRKGGGYRDGALRLLDRKIQKIRNGDYAKRGIKKNALVLPVVVCFDKVGETPVLYKWIDEECLRLGILSARSQVRPLTVLTPDDYEAIFALASRGKGVCDLLVEKTRIAERPRPMDWFLHHRVRNGRNLRAPGTEEEFDEIMERALCRLRANGIFG